MDGRHDPPCSRAGRMSLTKQLSFASTVTAVEAEGEPELRNPLTGVMAVGGLMTADTWL
ncbi:hypothetical protein PAMP_020070 [Pampus punctatissimus]